eukprot:205659-Prymnesium_polylepis.1
MRPLLLSLTCESPASLHYHGSTRLLVPQESKTQAKGSSRGDGEFGRAISRGAMNRAVQSTVSTTTRNSARAPKAGVGAEVVDGGRHVYWRSIQDVHTAACWRAPRQEGHVATQSHRFSNLPRRGAWV